MLVIGFFRDLLTSIGGLVDFISQPLGTQFEAITIEPFKSMSILGLMGIGLVGTLGVLLTIHLVRLFIGG